MAQPSQNHAYSKFLSAFGSEGTTCRSCRAATCPRGCPIAGNSTREPGSPAYKATVPRLHKTCGSRNAHQRNSSRPEGCEGNAGQCEGGFLAEAQRSASSIRPRRLRPHCALRATPSKARRGGALGGRTRSLRWARVGATILPPSSALLLAAIERRSVPCLTVKRRSFRSRIEF